MGRTVKKQRQIAYFIVNVYLIRTLGDWVEHHLIRLY